jgi:hypothetical protein
MTKPGRFGVDSRPTLTVMAAALVQFLANVGLGFGLGTLVYFALKRFL